VACAAATLKVVWLFFWAKPDCIEKNEAMINNIILKKRNIEMLFFFPPQIQK